MGTFAVASIMVGKAVLKYTHDPVSIQTIENSTVSIDIQPWTVDRPIHYDPLIVVSSLCLVVGCIQVSRIPFLCSFSFI